MPAPMDIARSSFISHYVLDRDIHANRCALTVPKSLKFILFPLASIGLSTDALHGPAVRLEVPKYLRDGIGIRDERIEHLLYRTIRWNGRKV